MVASAALRMETVKKVRSSEVEEKVEGERDMGKGGKGTPVNPVKAPMGGLGRGM